MAARKKNGQFIRGKSGNPTGRPHTETAAIRKQLISNSEAVIQVVTNAALGGDLQACRMILDRISPSLKAQTAPVAIHLPPEGDMTQLAEALIRAAAQGTLPIDIAAQMVSAVGQLARITEIKDHLPKLDGDPIFTGIEIEIIDSNKKVIETIKKEIPPSNIPSSSK